MNTIRLIISAFLLICITYSFAGEKEANVAIMYGVPAVEVKEVNLGTIKAGEEIICGCGLYNKGTSTLKISDVKISHPELKAGPSLTYIKPEMKIGFLGKLKFKSAIGNFYIKAQIYYFNITEPTIITFTGKVIDS